MKIIGLTGPSGSGKSTIGKAAEKLGYFVIDCDKVARQVSDENEILQKLESTFKGVLINGKLNRKELANKAFSSKENTEKLNRIMLPAVTEKIMKITEEQKLLGTERVLLDAPTLFESGLDKICISTIAVLSNIENRKERILRRDSLTESQLKSRLNAAKPKGFCTRGKVLP